MRQDLIVLGLLILLGIGTMALGNAVANRLSRPIEGSATWRDLFGK